MVRSVQVSEDLYLRLEKLARDRGIASVEALLERLAPGDQSRRGIHDAAGKWQGDFQRPQQGEYVQREALS